MTVRRFSALAPRTQGFLLGAVIAALLAAVLGVALAATSSNVIYGCYDKKGGELRVRKAGQACKDDETPVAWNKKGRRGPRGLPGEDGDDGQNGLLTSFDDVEGLPCTAGPGVTGEIHITYSDTAEVSLTCALPEMCGDGFTTGDEQCDDANNAAGDGCSSTCTIEQEICGDADITQSEQCDDGNQAAGDGCSSTCSIEGGWQCTGEPSVCTQGGDVCGNGDIEPSEQCDDGDNVSGDGCSNACLIEGGWQCAGEPSICSEE